MFELLFNNTSVCFNSDTSNSDVVDHFRNLACVAHPSLCATSSCAVVMTILGVTTSETDYYVYINRDTMDSSVVNHFRDLACQAHPGLCPTW